MSRANANDLQLRALNLALALGHKYFTVSHLLAVKCTNNHVIWSDVTKAIIETTPMIEPGDLRPLPTAGANRVLEKMASGRDFLAAVNDEGNDAYGPYFIKKHNIQNV
jgi:hypothetical protein